MTAIYASQNNNPKSHYLINLTNIRENETFCYSLPLIKGYISSFTEETIITEEKIIYLKKVKNNNESFEVTSWPTVNGNFKCLANLDVGKNLFVLQYEDCFLQLNLEFKLKKTDYHVLPVYIICDGDDGRFQAPEHENNSPESACKRISLGSKLIQSFTAEKLFESNMGRSTFQLASDMNLGVDCVIFHSKLSPEEIYDMEPQEIWEHFGRELMSSLYGSDKRKYLAFLSCTRYTSNERTPETYEEIISQVKGHVALGGGGLAIFGTGCLYTWPETINQIVPRFLDDTKVDRTKFMDDSCYRGTYGSCFSTTLGSVCHELGHTFDLGHSKTGIMARGFDNINLVFTMSNQYRDSNMNLNTRNDAQHATVCFTRNLNVTYSVSSPIRRPRSQNRKLCQNSPQRSNSNELEKNLNLKEWPNRTSNDNEKKKTVTKVLTDDLTFWDKSCSVLLKYHRWFANDDIPENMMSSIEFDQSRRIISSPSGIRVVELRGDDGLVLASWEFWNAYLPKQFTLPVKGVHLKYVKTVVAEDSMGSILKEPITIN